MKKAKIIAIIVGVFLLALIIFVFSYPNNFTVKNQYFIKAPPSLVYNNIKYLKNQHQWSPWDIYDRKIKKEIISTDGLEGATLIWQGNNKVGSGEIIWEKMLEDKQIDFTLKKEKPWQTKANCSIKLTHDNYNTILDFSYTIHTSFPWNISLLFKNLDKKVKKEFDIGFENFKDIIELKAKKNLNRIESFYGLSFRTITSTIVTDSVPYFIKQNNRKIAQKVLLDSGKLRHKPTALFHFNNKKDSISRVAAAYPLGNLYLQEKPYAVEKTKFGSLEKGKKRLVYNFFGKYKYKTFAHQELKRKIKQMKKHTLAPIIEEYIQDYKNQSDTNLWHTRIYYYFD